VRKLLTEGIKYTMLEFQMYIENCIIKDEDTGKVIVIQKPSEKGLISFIMQLRKAN
jgi:uncharacterized protein (UPF0179 family)